MPALQQTGLTRARYDSRQVAPGVTVVLYYRLQAEKFFAAVGDAALGLDGHRSFNRCAAL